MKPARSPRSNLGEAKLLVAENSSVTHTTIAHFPEFLRHGDLLVVNDAATLPASLRGVHLDKSFSGEAVEVRLMSRLDEQAWRAVVFGEGSWCEATENRKLPPPLRVGDEIQFAKELLNVFARIEKIDEQGRIVNLKFNVSGEALWSFLYREGRPIQYSYLKEDLHLWSVQTIYSSRPWAFEMPSAGHPLKWEVLLKLLEKGVRIATLTHGAGISSTGNKKIDDSLPLRERYEIPQATVDAIEATRKTKGRVIAVGTSVVRALEGGFEKQNEPNVHFEQGLKPGVGETDLIIHENFKLKVVDGILTGMHKPAESHFKLLRAFASELQLTRINHEAETHGYLTHEFGDSCLILRR
jgi:S-adenosylmethionine:tRNA ribosyltransferase-isomerase